MNLLLRKKTIMTAGPTKTIPSSEIYNSAISKAGHTEYPSEKEKHLNDNDLDTSNQTMESI